MKKLVFLAFAAVKFAACKQPIKRANVVFVILLMVKFSVTAQVVVTQSGLTFNNGEQYVIVENNLPANENINQIVRAIKAKHKSPNIKVETENNLIIITDFTSGYTKTDKKAGSAYLLDLSYKFVIEVKDNRFRINVPTIDISANQQYDSNAVVANKGVQFVMTMEFKGKSDVWNSDHKKLFIFDEKGKLVEKSTKQKLERDLSAVVVIITEPSNNSDW